MAKKSQLVGVDLGSYSVKVAEVDTGKNGMVLKNFGMALLPNEAVIEGHIKEKEAVTNVLKGLITHLNIKNKNVCTAVSGVSCILKKLPTVQGKTLEEIEQGLKGEVEQYIPFDMADVYIDHVVQLPDGKAPKPGERIEEAEVLVAAAPKELVDSYVEVFEAADLNPIVMDVGILAIQNAIEATVPELPLEHIIVDLGAEGITIHAVKKGMPVFTRDVMMGGAQLTRAIMANLGMGYWEAEEVKLGNRAVPAGKMELLKKLFVEYVTEWVREIAKAVEYIRTSFTDLNISHLYLSGGASLVPGIKEAISAETRLNVSYVDPFQGLLVDPKKFDEEYLKTVGPFATKVIGLALRDGKER